MKKLLLQFILLFSGLSLSAQNDLRSIYNAGMEAYKAEDFKQFLYQFQRADSISPDHPTIWPLLMQKMKCLCKLFFFKKVTLMNTGFKPKEDEDFIRIKDTAGFQSILDFRKGLDEVVKNSEVAFTNPEKDMHPELVAYDSKFKDFFLNSVRKGKVVRYDSKNKTFTDFASGLWSVMGMKVYKNSLWVCTVATSEHENYSEENEGKTALIQFYLKTSDLINRYELSRGHWFGDLVITKSCKIYVSDSRTPIIYILEKGSLVVFKDFSNQLFNLFKAMSLT